MQLHYTEWPDHGCPSSEGPILKLIRTISEIRDESSKKTVLVHCRQFVQTVIKFRKFLIKNVYCQHITYFKKCYLIICCSCIVFSAGCGRTGTVIAANVARELISGPVRIFFF